MDCFLIATMRKPTFEISARMAAVLPARTASGLTMLKVRWLKVRCGTGSSSSRENLPDFYCIGARMANEFFGSFKDPGLKARCCGDFRGLKAPAPSDEPPCRRGTCGRGRTASQAVQLDLRGPGQGKTGQVKVGRVKNWSSQNAKRLYR